MVSLFSTLLLACTAALNSTMVEVRKDFHQLHDAASLEQFTAAYSHIEEAAQAYCAVVEMRKANYVSNPYHKLKHFTLGKEQLEDYIAARPNCVEGRYCRYLAQIKCPRFLGYTANLEEDYNFVQSYSNNQGVPEAYLVKMRKTLKALKEV